MGTCGIALTEPAFSVSGRSELFDGRFRLQQNWNAVADGIDALALVTLQAVLAAKNERLSANRTGKDLEQVGRNHRFIVAYSRGAPPINAVTISDRLCALKGLKT